jgi:glycosyltransferase 2 family protein
VKAKGLLIGFAKYGLGFGLLAFMLWRSWEDKTDARGETVPGIRSLLQQTPDWGMVAFGAVLMAAVLLLQFYRWYHLVNAVGLPFSKRNAVRLGLVGYFYNIFMPGAIGGDLVKAVFIAGDHPTRKPVAVATVLIDRLLGLFGLVLLTTIVGGLGWLEGDPRILRSDYLQKIILVCSGVVGGIIVGWLLLGVMSEAGKADFEGRLHRLKPRGIGQTLAELWFAVRTYRERARVIYGCVAISAAAHVCMVLLFHVCVRVFPLAEPATLSEHAIIGPVGYIAQVFFPVPGGVGGAEAIFGFLYTRLERPEQTGVIGRLTLRIFFEMTAGVLGYVTFLLMKKELAPASPPPAGG